MMFLDQNILFFFLVRIHVLLCDANDLIQTLEQKQLRKRNGSIFILMTKREQTHM